jgi:hypothetical protein
LTEKTLNHLNKSGHQFWHVALKFACDRLQIELKC